MEEKKEEGTCGKGCGIRCGCCTCKAIKGLGLLVIGGAIGYGIARCGSHRMMCPMTSAATMQSESAPVSATTAAPKKAK